MPAMPAMNRKSNSISFINHKQNKDLSQQVATLLREVEAARFGRRTNR